LETQIPEPDGFGHAPERSLGKELDMAPLPFHLEVAILTAK